MHLVIVSLYSLRYRQCLCTLAATTYVTAYPRIMGGRLTRFYSVSKKDSLPTSGYRNRDYLRGNHDNDDSDKGPSSPTPNQHQDERGSRCMYLESLYWFFLKRSQSQSSAVDGPPFTRCRSWSPSDATLDVESSKDQVTIRKASEHLLLREMYIPPAHLGAMQ